MLREGLGTFSCVLNYKLKGNVLETRGFMHPDLFVRTVFSIWHILVRNPRTFLFMRPQNVHFWLVALLSAVNLNIVKINPLLPIFFFKLYGCLCLACNYMPKMA